MNKTTTLAATGALVILVLCVTVLAALGRDSEALITFTGSTIVPTLVALWGVNQASKAKDAATQAVHNTNGRMTELIQMVQQLGGTVDVNKYADLLSEGNDNGSIARSE